MPKGALARLEEATECVIELIPVVEGGKILSDLRVRKMKSRKFDNKPVRVMVDSRKGIMFQVKRTLHARTSAEEKPTVVARKK